MRHFVFVGLMLVSFAGFSQVRAYRIFGDGDMRWWVWLVAVDSTQEYVIQCGGLDTIVVDKGTVKAWSSADCPVDSELTISMGDYTWVIKPMDKEPISDLIPLREGFKPALTNPELLYLEVKPGDDSAMLMIIKNGVDTVWRRLSGYFSFAISVDTGLRSLQVVLDAEGERFVRSWYRHLESFFDTVSAEKLFHYANALLMLADAGMLKKHLESGDTLAVRREMKRLWQGKMNVFWEFKRRVDFALKEFSTRTEPGYETDRGRVLIQYGFPDQRFVKNMEPGVLPYEIWIYRQLEGFHNVRFVFYNPYIASNYYELIHSTLPGEVFNPYWERYVVQGDKSPSYWDPDRTRGRSYFGKHIRDYYEFYAPGD
ncbi:MAG: GWxTD domain-containing protein [Chlorobi bacterium]|nr:GWxTD domain-containing protein [Chlorobiota bacterium]